MGGGGGGRKEKLGTFHGRRVFSLSLPRRNAFAMRSFPPPPSVPPPFYVVAIHYFADDSLPLQCYAVCTLLRHIL